MKSPTSDVKPKDIEIFTLEEQRAYMMALEGEKYSMLFLTTLYTGMRLGEIIALKWDCINFLSDTITVKESCKRVKKYTADGNSFNDLDKKAPKTDKGKRTIAIPQLLSKELKTYKLASPNSDDNLVFCLILDTIFQIVISENIMLVLVILPKSEEYPSML